MNQVVLTGRLTKDPVVSKTTVKGEPADYCKFTLAAKDDGRDGVSFVNCTIWGKGAVNLEKYCSKGSMIGVTGKLQNGEYEKDGVKRYTMDVVCRTIEFLSSKQEDSYASKPGEKTIADYDDENSLGNKKTAKKGNKTPKNDDQNLPIIEDDLPF